MSSTYSSAITDSVRSNRGARTSARYDQNVTEVDANTPLLLHDKSSKKVRICTMCGRYKGIRMSRWLFILLCIILVILILLLGAVIVLYAIVPSIVRSTITKVQLGFRSVNIEQIENNQFHLRAQLELFNTGSIPATIVAPLIIQVDNVGKITISESISISGGSGNSTVVPIYAPFVVDDRQAFQNFTRTLIFQPNVVWNLKAEATIRPLWSHMISYSHIPFNKQVTLHALNGLTDVSIDSINLNRSDARRIIVDLIIKIKNPSVFSIDLGRLFFTLEYNNNSIGYVESNSSNTILHAGDNAIPFFGGLESTSSQSYDAISTIIKNYLTNQTSQVSALAGPNCTSYPLLASGMVGLSLNAEMPPFDQQLISSLKFDSMSLTPSTIDKTVTLSAIIFIEINSPLGPQSPLYVQTINMNVALLYGDNPVGTLNVIQAPVEPLGSMTYQTQINNKTLILDSTGATYEKFVQDFIKANQTYPINFRIGGLAAVMGSFALGPLNVDGIHVLNNVSLGGLDDLSNIHVDGISVNGEDGNALRLLINVTIQNPGITNVQLENFSLYMAEGINGTILGNVPIDILALQPGSNDITLNGLLAPLYEKDLPVVGKFFSAYLNGQTQPVKLFKNQSLGTNATAMDLTINGLVMKANLDGIKANLIRQINILDFGIEFNPDNFSQVYVTGQLSVLFELPSNINMTFKILTTSINFIMRMNSTEPAIGQINLENIPVQHNQTTNEILMNFQKQQFIVLNQTCFQQFAANLLLTSNVSFVIEGLTAALIQLKMGNITLTDIPVNDTLQVVGFNQFNGGHVRIDSIDVLGAISSQSLALQVKTEIINPSVVNMIYGGRLLLDLCDTFTEISLGLVNIDPFYLRPQGNATIVNAEGIFNMTKNNTNVARQFISNLVSGIDSQIELRGKLEDNSTGTNVPLLSLAVAGLRMHARLPGLTGDQALVRELRVRKLTAAEIFEITFGIIKVLPVRIRIVNPFSTSMLIQSLNIRADNGAKVDEEAQVGVVYDNTPLNITAHEELISPYVNVTITAKITTLAALIGPLLAGNAHLSLSGTISVIIGDGFVVNQLPVSLLNITTHQEPAQE